MKELFIYAGNTGLLSSLLDAKVEFLVIGGVAVAVYCEGRDCSDLDILLNNDMKNSTRIIYALSALGLGNIQSNPIQKNAQHIPLKFQNFNADLFTPQAHIDFSKLWERRVYAHINFLTVPIVSKCDLIEMKRHAKPEFEEDILKNSRDIELLTEVF